MKSPKLPKFASPEALEAFRASHAAPSKNAKTAPPRQLAKRQRTWFRTQLDVDWIDGPADAADVARAADGVLEIWKRHGKTPVAV